MRPSVLNKNSLLQVNQHFMCESQKKQKSHMETNINNSNETKSHVQIHTRREASGRGKAIILQESWNQTVVFPPLCWWKCDMKSTLVWFSVQVQTDLLLRAGEMSHRCCSRFWKTKTGTNSHLRHKRNSASGYGSQKQRNVHVLVRFHCLYVTRIYRNLPRKILEIHKDKIQSAQSFIFIIWMFVIDVIDKQFNILF